MAQVKSLPGDRGLPGQFGEKGEPGEPGAQGLEGLIGKMPQTQCSNFI